MNSKHIVIAIVTLISGICSATELSTRQQIYELEMDIAEWRESGISIAKGIKIVLSEDIFDSQNVQLLNALSNVIMTVHAMQVQLSQLKLLLKKEESRNASR